MAVTATVTGSSVIGAQRSIWGTFTSDSATGNFATGLKYVNSIIVTNSSDENPVEVHLNFSDAGSTAANGTVYFDLVSGDGGNWNAIGYGGG